jgi:hypothetical protein
MNPQGEDEDVCLTAWWFPFVAVIGAACWGVMAVFAYLLWKLGSL